MWQGNKQTGEMTANIEFLVAVGNDSHRILFTHIQSTIAQNRSFVFHDNTISNLFDEFGSIIDTACKQMSKILFSGLHSTILDFDQLWGSVPNLLVSVTSSLGIYLRDIKPCSHPMIWKRVMGHCADICVMRLLMMLRDRVGAHAPAPSSGSTSTNGTNGTTSLAVAAAAAAVARDSANNSVRFTAAELSRLVGDIDHLLSIFGKEEAADTVDHVAVEPQCVNDQNIEASSFEACSKQFITECSARLLAALQNLQDLQAWFVLPYDKEEFGTLCRHIVRRYRALGSQGSTSYSTNSGSIYTAVANNLLACVASLRPDGGVAIQTLINVIVENHGGRLGASSDHANKGSGSGQHSAFDCSEDAISRVFGIKSDVESTPFTSL